jgi:DNA-binding transcriptional MerR regulator
MSEKFYTSTEAAEITQCTRRQLQYWRERGIIVPTVNSTGKGRNVYYSLADLVALTAMQYLLSIGLSFETSQITLDTLRRKEPMLFRDELEPLGKKFMLLLGAGDQPELTEFDIERATEEIARERAVVPFGTDYVLRRLQKNLQGYSHQLTLKLSRTISSAS